MVPSIIAVIIISTCFLAISLLSDLPAGERHSHNAALTRSETVVDESLALPLSTPTKSSLWSLVISLAIISATEESSSASFLNIFTTFSILSLFVESLFVDSDASDDIQTYSATEESSSASFLNIFTTFSILSDAIILILPFPFQNALTKHHGSIQVQL
eukprot:CAMPEP_0170096926 /NCGR_PEP_ID=MMETSP0019_2-20121128/28896_1 /TAXON_ID=98059 /ORGANISM="Dinobryon sp., Strain UTEXLB2267" /LENGTH=158 /DNA_ID=CAMNT_0010319049 /DNA_START=32 /DNA_END=504 /DNA_ORIENTATION=-